jgi:hypothetical protein
MSKAIRAHNFGAMAAMVLLIALLIVLVTLAPALRSEPTAGERASSPAGHTLSAGDPGGTTITQDPNIERHAEMVQSLGKGRLH